MGQARFNRQAEEIYLRDTVYTCSEEETTDREFVVRCIDIRVEVTMPDFIAFVYQPAPGTYRRVDYSGPYTSISTPQGEP